MVLSFHQLKLAVLSLLLVIAVDGTLFADAGSNPTKMLSIPSGTFTRSDGKAVSVEGFSLLSTEITWTQFKDVCDWGKEHGYEFDGGIGQADLPAQDITWYDAVKYCNALSELTGRGPAYFTDATGKTLYRTGRIDLSNDFVNWKASGFRLPTEAEWEMAYRAGTTTNFYRSPPKPLILV